MMRKNLPRSFAGTWVVISTVALFPASMLAQPTSQTEEADRVSERLRHKERAATEEPTVQHNQSDLEFTKKSAERTRVPAHTPE